MPNTQTKSYRRNDGRKKKEKPVVSGEIRGRVMDADGEPLEEVSVAIADGPSHIDFAALTEADGEFSLGSLEPGEYTVRAFSSDALESGDVIVEVQEGRIAYVEIWLS